MEKRLIVNQGLHVITEPMLDQSQSCSRRYSVYDTA